MCVLGKDHNFQTDSLSLDAPLVHIRGCEVKLCGLKWISFIYIIFFLVIHLVILNLGDLDSYKLKCLLWGLIHHIIH